MRTGISQGGESDAMISASRHSDRLTAMPGRSRNEAARQAANRGPAPCLPHCQISIFINAQLCLKLKHPIQRRQAANGHQGRSTEARLDPWSLCQSPMTPASTSETRQSSDPGSGPRILTLDATPQAAYMRAEQMVALHATHKQCNREL